MDGVVPLTGPRSATSRNKPSRYPSRRLGRGGRGPTRTSPISEAGCRHRPHRKASRGEQPVGSGSEPGGILAHRGHSGQPTPGEKSSLLSSGGAWGTVSEERWQARRNSKIYKPHAERLRSEPVLAPDSSAYPTTPRGPIRPESGRFLTPARQQPRGPTARSRTGLPRRLASFVRVRTFGQPEPGETSQLPGEGAENPRARASSSSRKKIR